MDNENRKPKDSKLAFLEKAVWKRGQEIITVLLTDENGRRQKVAHIFYQYSKEHEKSVYVTSDAKGNGMLPPTTNLYDLKKQIITIEAHLAKKLRDQQIEKAREHGTGREEGRER